MKRLFQSLNLAATLVLLLVLFLMVNFMASRHYARWDLTKQKFTQLSDQTKRVLANIKDPVSVIVFYDPSHTLYEPIRDLLREYQRANPKIEVQLLDPQQDPARARKIVEELKIDSANLVVFKSGKRHKYLPETDLAEYDYGAMQLGAPPRLKSFKAESAFTSAILNVTQESQPRVWFTTGHGEKSVKADDPLGLTELKRILEQQNMAVEETTLLDKASIPADTNLIIIAGPNRRFAESEVKLLDEYLAGGGRVLFMLDPLTETGLEGLPAKWGITVDNDIVVDPARQLPFVSAANLFVVEYQQHPIVERMRTLATIFPLARSVRPAKEIPENATVSVLAQTSPQGWGETKTDVETFQFDAGADIQGPVSIAAAAQAKDPGKTRLVVVGDSEFATNSQIASAGNGDLASGIAHWLVDQETLIGIGPKPIEGVKLQLTEAQTRAITWFSLLVMPLLCLAAGAGIWWIRRA